MKNNYTVLECTTREIHEEKAYCNVTIFVDNEGDIPEPEETWLPGSMCLIADTKVIKLLNHERMWV